MKQDLGQAMNNNEGIAIDEELRTFRIEVEDSELAKLHDRLAGVRWAPEPIGGAEGYGVSRAAVQALVEHWRDRYDWRSWEASSTRTRSSRPPLTGPTYTFCTSVPPNPIPCPWLSAMAGRARSRSSSTSSAR
jgi:hypothetical protein